MNTERYRISLKAVGCLAVLLLAVTSLAVSQSDLENNLKQMGSSTVTGYIQPVTNTFGADMHSGYFHAADIEKFGFHLRLDFVAMGAAVSDDQKTFDAPIPAGYGTGTVKAPTVFGGSGAGTEVTNGVFSKRLVPDGVFNINYMPLIVPQITIGNVYGTQATVRFLPIPEIENGKIPKITLWGVGVRHNISQYVPLVPVDLSAGVYFNSFTFGDLISFKGVAIDGQVSKSFSILTLYGGLQWENSSMQLTYLPTSVTEQSVDISMDGTNHFRFIAGLDLGLGPIHIFGDANLGSVTVFSAGIGFGN